MELRHKVAAIAFLLVYGGAAQAGEHQHHPKHDHDDADSGFENHHAHEHGAAQLNLVIEGNGIELTFSSPAMNIVGFEHAANAEADKKTLQQAQATLARGAELFDFGSAAGCTLKQASVESALLGNSTETADAGHADFDADYDFECKAMDKLKNIRVMLLEKFPATEQVRVNLVTAKGQSSQTLDAKTSVISLP